MLGVGKHAPPRGNRQRKTLNKGLTTVVSAGREGAAKVGQAQAGKESQTEPMAPQVPWLVDQQRRDMMRVLTDHQAPSQEATTAATVRDLGRGGSRALTPATTGWLGTRQGAQLDAAVGRACRQLKALRRAAVQRSCGLTSLGPLDGMATTRSRTTKTSQRWLDILVLTTDTEWHDWSFRPRPAQAYLRPDASHT